MHETLDGVEAAPVAKGTVFAAEPQPIVHLRAFSNYLSPRLGIFSADVWVLGAIYLRNLLLNQAAIAPAILAVIFLARLMYWAFLRENQALWKEHATGAMAGVVVLSVFALVWIIYSLWRLDQIHQERGARKIVMQLRNGPLHLFVLLPLVISACLVCRILVSEGVHFWSAFWNVIRTTFTVVLEAAGFGPLSAPWLGLLTCIAVGVGAGLLILRCISPLGGKKWPIVSAIFGGLIVTALLLGFSPWTREPWEQPAPRAAGGFALALPAALGWEMPWRRSVASGVLVGTSFFTVVLVVQAIWFARFVWLAFGWHWHTSGWALLGFAGWLLASFFVGLVGGFVVSVPVFFLGHLLDQNSAWAIYLWCGALLAAPHVLGYLLCLILGARVKAPANRERHQGRTTDIPRAILEPAAPGRIRELFTVASPGALLAWAVLGVATGVGSLVLFFTLHSLGRLLLLDRLTAEYPYWHHAVGWGLTIGCLLGWAHLYYLLILLLRFGHAGWEKSGDAGEERIANEKRWSRFLRHLQLKDSGAGLVISLGVGIFVSGALWAFFGEQAISASLGLPAGAGLFVPPAASVALFLLWRCPGLRRAPIWLGAGLASGMLGGVLLYILADLIDPNAGRSMSLAAVAASALGSLGLPAEAAPLATASALVCKWPPDPLALAFTVAFGPPAVLAIVGLMIALEVGVLSRLMAESVREWLGSVAGWLLIYSTWYVIVFGVALFGGWLLNETGPVLNTVLGAGWLTTALAGVLAGHSARTGADGDSIRLEIIARGAPYVFLLGLLFLLAWLVGFLVNDPPDESFGRQQVALVTTPAAPATKVAQISKTHSENGESAQQTEDHVRTREQREEQPEASIRRAVFWEGMRRAKVTTLLGWLFGLLALAALMAWRIDVNLFSLSALYGNRLIRCYLGASRARPPSADPLAVGAPIDNPITAVALHPGAVGTPRIEGPIQGPATLVGGGELSVGAPCYYVITALTPKEETAPSNEQTVTPSLVQRTAQLSWLVHPQAVGYRIYRSEAPGNYASPALLASIKDGHATSYVDAGADVADAALPQSTGFVGRPADPVRQPNPITGLDDQDDMPLRQLVIERPAGPVQNEAALGAGGALTVGVAHYYVITAVAAAGETAHSQEQHVSPTGGPAPRRTAHLSWQPHAGASEYRLYRSLKSGQYASPALLATIRTSDVTAYVDAGADVSPYDDRQYTGPYVLINAALNLVHAENLAWQERKAESFVFTPLFCGSEGTGFQPLVFKHADGSLAEKIQRFLDDGVPKPALLVPAALQVGQLRADGLAEREAFEQPRFRRKMVQGVFQGRVATPGHAKSLCEGFRGGAHLGDIQKLVCRRVRQPVRQRNERFDAGLPFFIQLILDAIQRAGEFGAVESRRQALQPVGDPSRRRLEDVPDGRRGPLQRRTQFLDEILVAKKTPRREVRKLGGKIPKSVDARPFLGDLFEQLAHRRRPSAGGIDEHAPRRRRLQGELLFADRHKEHSVPLDALNDIRADLQMLLARLMKEWLDTGPALGDIMAKLHPLLHGGKLPLSVRQVRQVLGGLESLLQSRLPPGLSDDFPRRFIRRLENSLYLQPLVWLVPLPRQTPAPHKWSEKLYACGLICLLPKSSHRSEVLFWVRGPYRNLGIGHECFEKPLRQICERLKILDQCDCLGNGAASGSDDVKLLAVYPNGNLPDSAAKLERAIWLSFFFDYGFRRQQPADEQSPVDLILERGLKIDSLLSDADAPRELY